MRFFLKIKIGKEAASFALKAQQKELNYDDQSQNRGKESEVFQNVLEGLRSKLGAIRKSFKRQKEQRNEFMKIWQQANPVMPKIPSDKVAKYNYKIDNIVTKPKVVVAQVRELCVRLGTVTEDAHKNEMGIAKSWWGAKYPVKVRQLKLPRTHQWYGSLRLRGGSRSAKATRERA